jgi:tetratricopeptide (TPR) repeat protein
MAAGDVSVKVWTEPLVIPTYQTGGPERNPIFYFGRAYQGAKGPVYPYPFLDVLTDTRVNKTYTALYLENSYVRICVLPELGGRIFEAVDKTNGYNFFYHQHVIKPALIGMVGAWISGGVEWNIPHHHRATTFMPVDWTVAENADGSRTIWVGETELRHRMKWLVGLTLRPDRSTLEVTYKIFNRTPLAHSILCWANAAVHANENYQVIFPPSTRLATFHGKNQFSHWPISREIYNGVDYTRGVDVSWWKNHPSPTSFFAFEAQEDFFGGYDHGRKAGVIFIGDHRLVPGKKLWTWGTGSEGARWEKILTDEDGPYLELMVGSFSDNQPDYSWIQPGEVKNVTQYWYPLRDIGGVKNANADAAVNLELNPGLRAFIGFVTTSFRKGARVLLTAGAKTVYEQKADLGPERPFTAEVPLPAGASKEILRLSLIAADGKEIISLEPQKGEEPSLPQPVTPPLPPAELQSNEELYLAGLRLEQFYNPALEPYPYYEEALRRDQEDVRANTALGRLYLMRGMYQEAEKKLRRAVTRLTANYTRPKDGEAIFYLGIALRAQGLLKEAGEAFARASWSAAWASASFEQMAELAVGRGDFQEALTQIERSLALNGANTRANDIKACLLRNLGRTDEAERQARSSLALDPLDFWAANELVLAKTAQGQVKEAASLSANLGSKMRDAAENYLELAADYSRCGLYAEAGAVLSRLAGRKTKEAAHPMLYYDLAYYSYKLGKMLEARRFLQEANRMPPDFCFPFRLESLDVLRWTEQENPLDARAEYYLGNLLFDLQPEKAVEAWERSKQLDGSLATVHRNLGLAYARVNNDLPRAVNSLEKAVACDPHDPRLYFELDQLYDLAAVSPQKRLDLLLANHAVVAERDDALTREITLLVELGRYDRAIELLKGHHFHVWEGGGEIYGVWVDAHLGRGQKRRAEKKFEQAGRDFEAALEYPKNLEVGKPVTGAGSPEIYYFLGTVEEARGKSQVARDAYEHAAQFKVGPSEQTYYQGLSRRKLGDGQKASETFAGLIAFAQENLAKSPSLDYFAKFGERESALRREARYHYLLGLGLLGSGHEADAKAEFQKALALYPHYARAIRQLAYVRGAE